MAQIVEIGIFLVCIIAASGFVAATFGNDISYITPNNGAVTYSLSDAQNTLGQYQNNGSVVDLVMAAATFMVSAVVGMVVFFLSIPGWITSLGTMFHIPASLMTMLGIPAGLLITLFLWQFLRGMSTDGMR